jgi:hypothetical protein
MDAPAAVGTKRPRDSGSEATYSGQLRLLGVRLQTLMQEINATIGSEAVAPLLRQGESLLREIEAVLTPDAVSESYVHCTSALRMHVIAIKALLPVMVAAQQAHLNRSTSQPVSPSPTDIVFTSLISILATSAHLLTVFARTNPDWIAAHQQCLTITAEAAHRINPLVFSQHFVPLVMHLVSQLSRILSTRPRCCPPADLFLPAISGRATVALASEQSSYWLLSAVVLLVESLLGQRVPLLLHVVDRHCLLEGIGTVLSVASDNDPGSLRVADSALATMCMMASQGLLLERFAADGPLVLWTVVAFARHLDLRSCLTVHAGRLIVELVESYFKADRDEKQAFALQLLQLRQPTPTGLLVSGAGASNSNDRASADPGQRNFQFLMDVAVVAVTRKELWSSPSISETKGKSSMQLLVELLTDMLTVAEIPLRAKRGFVHALLSKCMGMNGQSLSATPNKTSPSSPMAVPASSLVYPPEEEYLVALRVLGSTLLQKHFSQEVTAALVKWLSSCDSSLDMPCSADPGAVEAGVAACSLLLRALSLSSDGQLSLSPKLSVLRSTLAQYGEFRFGYFVGNPQRLVFLSLRHATASLLAKCSNEDFAGFQLTQFALWEEELSVLQNLIDAPGVQLQQHHQLALVEAVSFFWETFRAGPCCDEKAATAMFSLAMGVLRPTPAFVSPTAVIPVSLMPIVFTRAEITLLASKLFKCITHCICRFQPAQLTSIVEALERVLSNAAAAAGATGLQGRFVSDFLDAVVVFISASIAGEKNFGSSIEDTKPVSTNPAAAGVVVVDVDDGGDDDDKIPDAEKQKADRANDRELSFATPLKEVLRALLSLVGLPGGKLPSLSAAVKDVTIATSVARVVLSWVERASLLSTSTGSSSSILTSVFDPLVFAVMSKQCVLAQDAYGTFHDQNQAEACENHFQAGKQKSSSEQEQAVCSSPSLLLQVANTLAAMSVSRSQFELPDSLWAGEDMDKLAFTLSCTANMLRRLAAVEKLEDLLLEDSAAASPADNGGPPPLGVETAPAASSRLQGRSNTVLRIIIVALRLQHRHVSSPLVRLLTQQVVLAGMSLQQWSAEDIVRLSSSSSSLAGGELCSDGLLQLLCRICKCDRAVILVRSADLLYAKAAASGDSVGTSNFINAIGGPSKLRDEGRPVVLAYFLMEHAQKFNAHKASDGSPEPPELVLSIAKFSNFCGKKLEETPELVRRHFSPCFIAVLSHADRTSFEACWWALEVVATLACCDGTAADIKRSMAAKSNITAVARHSRNASTTSQFPPMRRIGPASSGSTATEAMKLVEVAEAKIITSRIIEIVDFIVRNHIGVTFEHSHNQQQPRNFPATSGTTQLRWLRALGVLLQFLRTKATLVAPKLPAVFEECAKIPMLRVCVCMLWQTLVLTVDTEYLRIQGAVFATDLLLLERVARAADSGATTYSQALKFLQPAMTTLFTRTCDEPFWGPFHTVLRNSSVLINTSLSSDSSSSNSSSIEAFIESFVSVIHGNASANCHDVFVRALHARLSSDERGGFSSAKNAELLVRTLLYIASAKQEGPTTAHQQSAGIQTKTQLLACECVGLVGAVAPTRRNCSGAGCDSSSSAATRNPHLDPPLVSLAHVELWRDLARDLLQHHCMRALNNTSDPVMHDRLAHTVQLLLRVCVSEERSEISALPLSEDEFIRVEEMFKFSWWSGLEGRTKRSLLPFASTKYHSHAVSTTDRRCPEARRGMSYVDWRWNWFKNLSSRISGIFGRIFESVRNVAKRDGQLCSFLLPLLVLHIIRADNEADLLDVFAEFSAVLDPEAAPHLEEHVHQLFCVLENVRHVELTLRREAIRQKEALADSAQQARIPTKTAHSQFQSACARFLDRLAPVLLVKGAIAVNSPMQALRFLETERYLPQLTVTIQRTPNLQKLFSELQDVESAQAVHNNTTFPEGDWGSRAISHERNGEWQLALQACEVHLQAFPASAAHQVCALRCLQHLGQLHLMAHFAKSLLSSSTVSSSSSSSPLIPAGMTDQEWAGRKSSTTTPTSVDSQQQQELLRYANEARWRLGMWDDIELSSNLQQPVPATLMTPDAAVADTSPTSLVGAVVALRRFCSGCATLEAVTEATRRQRMVAGVAAAAAAKESYVQAYPFVLCLHALSDIDLVANVIAKQVPNRLQGIIGDKSATRPVVQGSQVHLAAGECNKLLDHRLKYVHNSASAREAILALHRRIFALVGATDDSSLISSRWVQYAKLLKDDGFLDAALTAARQAAQGPSAASCPSAFRTFAKLLYEKGDYVQAVDYAKAHAGNSGLHDKFTRAALLLHATNWTQEASLVTPKEIAESYAACLKVDATEKGHFAYGRFLDKMFHATKALLEKPLSASSSSSASSISDHPAMLTAIETYAIPAIDQYGSALLSGDKTYVIGLPRLLTLWLDCAAYLAALRSETPIRARAEQLANMLTARIDRLFLSAAQQHTPPVVIPKILFTGLSQLVSRLGHAHQDSLALLVKMLLRLLGFYPHQTLWALLPVYHNTKQPERAAIIKSSVFSAFQRTGKEQAKILTDAISITAGLISICNADFEKEKLTTVDVQDTPYGKSMQRVFSTSKFILPLIATLTPNFSPSFARRHSETFGNPQEFLGFEGKATILSSLQKPKKISVRTRDGAVVPYLFKGKDEPRKDLRMMDIASLINKLFLEDPASRRKGFALRRYAVAALSEDTALIEWVENTTVLRKVTDEAYALDGTGVTTKQVKEWLKKIDEKKLTVAEMFHAHIFPATKPVLHQWLQCQFQRCSEWYAARGLFTQSCALWSIVGHILGVGDRHAENLMIDRGSGEMLHVDFAFMFDKGETLKVPERVRFRLTQNLIDGMGLVGCNGPFRSACATALRTQSRHKDALMTVLDALLHDPLVEWVTRAQGSDRADPKQLFARVARRLDGFLDLYAEPREKDTFALSVDGQVAKLIHHSSSADNLMQMYTWWMAWI